MSDDPSSSDPESSFPGSNGSNAGGASGGSPEPTDGTTLTEVLTGYSEAGFTSSFSVTADSRVLCETCETISAPEAVAIQSLRRLEGASDPDDMMAVAALSCPSCSSQGTLILGYGASATAEDSDVLRLLQDERHTGALPQNSAPGQAHGDTSH